MRSEVTRSFWNYEYKTKTEGIDKGARVLLGAPYLL